MTENDPFKLSDAREGEADRMAQRSQDLGEEVEQVREEWRRKRADPDVPGAPPLPEDEAGDDGGEQRPESPAPQAPPPSAGPGEAETPPEGGAGPPADVIDD